MNTLEIIYAKTSTFGRDLFYYLLPAILFYVISLNPLLFGYKLNYFSLEVISKANFDSFEKTIFIIIIIFLSYGFGQFLLILGFLYEKLWIKLCEKFYPYSELKKIKEKIEKLSKERYENVLPSLYINNNSSGNSSDKLIDPDSHHVLFEMLVFEKMPNVHSYFINRYNILSYLRLSFASSILFGGLVCSILFYKELEFYILVVLSISIGSSFLFMRQHFITQISFLSRIIAAYVVYIECNHSVPPPALLPQASEGSERLLLN